MNRLILIGNGFDLAHGMKTSYNDFILWYLKKCFEEANEGNVYEDDLIQISKRHNSWKIYMNNVSALVDYFHKGDLTKLFTQDNLDVSFENYTYPFNNPFQGKIKSDFLKLLLTKCTKFHWVDIEKEFYTQLKACLPISTDHTDYKFKQLSKLNYSLKIIIDELEKFLTIQELSKPTPDYSRIFDTYIKAEDLCTKQYSKNEKSQNTLILNFNYTNTPEQYLVDENSFIKMNYIHGKVGIRNNPLIFGFGDELDKNYEEMELQKSNEFFEYIKSFWYFKTSNYHNLVRFVDGEEFQVFIIGHSCGLSDRTMLNMIFEHENCKSIKIFYHGNKEKNNYTNLTQEISRHFKDKGMMRKKIVPFDKSEPMTQVNQP